MKLDVQIECQLGYLIMLILNGICQYETKYAVLKKIYAIFGTKHASGTIKRFRCFLGFADKG